eukprot:m.333579 g.333579  ORF g.333579 m.333579 type:complete len:581 (-) comp16522_c0_seq8:633-2375(-)
MWRCRLPFFRPLQWAVICLALGAVGLVVLMLSTPATPPTWIDTLKVSDLPPDAQAALSRAEPLMERITGQLRTEVDIISRLSTELDKIERFVRSEVEKKPERPVLTHHAQTKSPPAPPSPRKPVEVPVIGDPNGRRSLSPVDFAKAPPIPVLMLTCNRVSVRRALDLIVKYRWSPQKFPIFLSQDCEGSPHHAKTKAVLESYVADHGATLYHQDNTTDPLQGRPRKEKKWSGYYKIARHYKFALDKVFSHPAKYDSVIIVEDDLDVAPDFFEFFLQGRELLRADPTLFCVSAWNDNGKSQHVADPQRVYRTDFFPGLGWLILRSLWEDELAAKWTHRYWDDWMRLPAQRKGRSCIRPEIGRTRTYGEKGVSKGQFYKKYLKFIKLNDQFVNFTAMNMSYLLKRNYDEALIDHVKSLTRIEVTQLTALTSKLDPRTEYVIEYTSNTNFQRMAKALDIMSDNKEGIFRTAYLGIVSLVWRRRGHPEDPPIRLHLAPRESVTSPLLGFDNRLTQPRSCSGHGMDTSLEDRQLSQSVVLIASSRRASIFCLSTRDQSTVRHGRRTVLEPHTHTSQHSKSQDNSP